MNKWLYIYEKNISEKIENQNELYFLVIWNSTAGGVPVSTGGIVFLFPERL